MTTRTIEFRTEGESVLCVRIDTSPPRTETIVASFDASVDRIAPHVAAALTAPERQALKKWLEDRKQLQQTLLNETPEDTVLRSLPALLDEAITAATSTDRINVDTCRDIQRKLETLQSILNQLEETQRHQPPELEVMNDEEVLRQRLSEIRKQL